MPITIHHVNKLDRAIALGEAVFETCRIVEGHIFGWDQHLARLAQGAVQLSITWEEGDLQQLSQAVLQQAASRESMLRLTLSPGEAEWGIIAAGDAPQAWLQWAPPPQPKVMHLISMQSPLATQAINAKFSSNYSIMLRNGGRTILQQGAMPLLWDHHRLLSAATANIAILHRNHWRTPPCDQGGVLPGTIRQHLLQSGALHEGECHRDMVSNAEAIALLNSGGFVQAASSIDGRALSPNNPAFAELRAPFAGVDGAPW